ncbi:ATP synthase F1 subcomplex delta subunit [Candidatus Koribacter versatilis Ellin345]|uniref:ATP synthase subunit delta n=1 Tax=Koribacter versatilis (strain Ellin345) TaxID=204669 RepID=ATPD_KORVE|nr:ATP synthase F1 subunit delta [Candidatus Koribacter versatilis]Q1IIG5.1 RecName: Full=ATP synthase subunit delta; AltName: Full=ATP synthase F(1) sector subunit delta; AltName: Full=F-type ATPase subunit delta; Short=F-ATPase subunit delta [Candidatus Koribacter versatilis Ellin345]ABF43335.1 ATP synthase F1 subcomplex delta subunit [Candidatus Koribacter versatilis Ellin345]
MASVTIRYANALADVVLSNRLDVTTAVRDLNNIVSMTIESEDLRKVWENPSIAVAQKRAILDGLVGMVGTPRIIRNFVAVLIDHQRVPLLPRIARQFELELNHRMGFADAEVTSVHELSAQDRQMIEQQIAKVVGKSVRARYKTNATLLGGAIIRVGSTVYDGSIKGQLAKIKEQLSAS